MQGCVADVAVESNRQALVSQVSIFSFNADMLLV